jgi:D-alanyl-D-alanine dipeptidase
MNQSNRLSFKPLALLSLLGALLVFAPLAFAQNMDTISNGDFVNVAIVYSRKNGTEKAINPCGRRVAYNILNNNPQKALLSPEAVKKLEFAAERLRIMGYSLLVYDAYRPSSVQNMLGSCTGEGSLQNMLGGLTGFDSLARATQAHTKGNAVDVTLIRTVNGGNDPQDMGTSVNDLGQCSFARFEGMCAKGGKLSSTDLNNRKILRNAMINQAGWCQPDDTGWWHFELCKN